MSYYYDDDDFDMFDQEDYDEYETVYQDYDHFIDAHFEEAWLSDHTDSQEYPAHRSIPRRSSDYTMRSSASPQKTTTIIKSPQTQALDLYKSDSEDSYDQEELAFYLDKSMDIDNLSAKQKEHHHDDPQVAFEIGQKYAALKSMHKAIGWYKLAAAKDHTEAQISIGDYYKAKNNPKLAKEWYTMAYNKSSGEAAYKLGLVCKQNKDKNAKDKNAMEWFLKAYDGGEGKAAFQIGKMYQTGELGISRNYNQAMEWYLKGDQAGDDSSTKHIGDMYNAGLGVRPQVQVAVGWYKKAYKRGNVDAAFEIGQLYYDDVMHDPHTEKEALKWFYRAAISGHQEASDRLDDLRDEGYALGSKSQAAIVVERDTDKMKQTYEQEIEALKKEIQSKSHHIETLTSELATFKNEK